MKKNKKIIDIEEYVLVNGIEQYFYHSGNSFKNPVMLFLHGGPGSPFSSFSHIFQKNWEDLFTVVHWDQRGAGKTLSRNPRCIPTVELMIEDLLQVVRFLKNKYHKQKIVLLGGSWGSVLGSIFIKKYPEEVKYYIGVGQIIGVMENEFVGYNKLKQEIINAKDSRSMKKLNKIGNYPGNEIDAEFMKKCSQVRKLQAKYKLAFEISLPIIFGMLKSPRFKFSDISGFSKADKINEKVWKFLGTFDLQKESAMYEVPIYYVLGGNDWQAPYPIAEKYFKNIEAPNKGIYIIPNAGHFSMFDQPELFYNVLKDISDREKLNTN